MQVPSAGMHAGRQALLIACCGCFSMRSLFPPDLYIYWHPVKASTKPGISEPSAGQHLACTPAAGAGSTEPVSVLGVLMFRRDLHGREPGWIAALWCDKVGRGQGCARAPHQHVALSLFDDAIYDQRAGSSCKSGCESFIFFC